MIGCAGHRKRLTCQVEDREGAVDFESLGQIPCPDIVDLVASKLEGEQAAICANGVGQVFDVGRTDVVAVNVQELECPVVCMERISVTQRLPWIFKHVHVRSVHVERKRIVKLDGHE